MSFGKKIRQLRKEANLTALELANQINILQPNNKISRTTITMWETKAIANPRLEHVINAAKVFGISVESLLNDNETPIKTNKRLIDKQLQVANIPLLNPIEAVDFFNNNIKPTEFLHVDRELKSELDAAAFAIRVSDKSMSPNIQPNDILVFKAPIEPEPGDIIACLIDEIPALQIRRYTTPVLHQIYLKPIHQDWPAYAFEVNTMQILGIAIEHRARLLRDS